MLIVTLIAGLAFGQSPVSRVVELIRNLKVQIETDGKDEQAVYDKLATWCKETKSRKNNDIDTATDRIDELTQQITQNSGKKGTFEAEIKQLKKEIAANEVARAEATTIRNKQNASYSKERADAETCVGALEHATKVLSGAGSALQKSQTLSLVKDVNVAIQKLPMGSIVTDEEKRILGAFLNKKAGTFLQSGNNPFGDYAPQSTKIQGILKNMYDTFVGQLERSNGEEANQNKGFKELIATKLEEKEILETTLTQKQTAEAENTQSLSEQKLERSNLRTQVRTDKTFLQETKDNCFKQANAWAERTRLRTEELAGIDKAIEILSSKEEVFNRSATTFLQQPKKKDKKKPAPKNSSKAYRLLSHLAQKHDSIRLATLAVSVQSKGHFAKVMRLIDNMMATIRAEDQDDIDARGRCRAEYEALKSENGDLARFLEKNDQLLELLQKDAERLDESLGKTAEEITAVKDEMSKAQEERVAAQKEFQKALGDDREASKAIGEALVTLTNFYKDNNIPIGFVEKKGEKKKQGQEPKYDDQDVTPEGFAGKSYGGKKSESGGIIAVLKMLQDDVENEIKESIASESEAQQGYEGIQAASRDNLKALQRTKANLNTAKAVNAQKAAAAENVKNNLTNLDGANGGSFEAHCTECQWIYSSGSPEFSHLTEKCPTLAVSDASSFETRKKKRADELSGLQDAKSSLAGAEEEE